MDMKQLLEFAGLDTSKGKAKALLESRRLKLESQQDEMPEYEDLDDFTQAHPHLHANVNMGTYSIGVTQNGAVKSGMELLNFITTFVDAHAIVGGIGVAQSDRPNKYDVIAIDAHGEFSIDRDTLGSFVIQS